MSKQSISLPLALAITAGWIAITLLLMFRHEIWLDEAHHWLLAKDSNSIGELLVNMRYEGHPPLWNFLLFGVSGISGSILAMQILHLCFAGGTVFLILRYAPFPIWVKVLLPFTYFFGYEYAIIARNYAPALFCVVIALILVRELKKNFAWFVTALAFAALFHMYFGMVGAILIAYFLYEQRSEKEWSGKRYVLAGAFVIFLIAIVYWIYPPSDHFNMEVHRYGFSLHRIGTALLLPFRSLFHFPELTGDYWWNTNLFLPYKDLYAGIIGVIFWIAVALVFWKDKSILIAYAVGTIIISIVMLKTPMPLAVRHAGIVAVLFFCFYWMLSHKQMGIPISARIVGFVSLVVQIAAYAVTCARDYKLPFSNAKNVASFIDQNYPNVPVVVNPHYSGPPVSAYLGRQVYYTEQRKFASFTSWKWGAWSYLDATDEMLIECSNFMEKNNTDSLIVVCERPGGFTLRVEDTRQLVARFDGAAVDAENYLVYILKRK